MRIGRSRGKRRGIEPDKLVWQTTLIRREQMRMMTYKKMTGARGEKVEGDLVPLLLRQACGKCFHHWKVPFGKTYLMHIPSSAHQVLRPKLQTSKESSGFFCFFPPPPSMTFNSVCTDDFANKGEEERSKLGLTKKTLFPSTFQNLTTTCCCKDFVLSLCFSLARSFRVSRPQPCFAAQNAGGIEQKSSSSAPHFLPSSATAAKLLLLLPHGAFASPFTVGAFSLSVGGAATVVIVVIASFAAAAAAAATERDSFLF